ncbi:hypothetical protein B0H13DRAFT_2261263 [Mycena leptocephala]|nr:hypothetical protein B0H13DRAFT_2261263 [Mycena leptocephala]
MPVGLSIAAASPVFLVVRGAACAVTFAGVRAARFVRNLQCAAEPRVSACVVTPRMHGEVAILAVIGVKGRGEWLKLFTSLSSGSDCVVVRRGGGSCWVPCSLVGLVAGVCLGLVVVENNKTNVFGAYGAPSSPGSSHPGGDSHFVWGRSSFAPYTARLQRGDPQKSSHHQKDGGASFHLGIHLQPFGGIILYILPNIRRFSMLPLKPWLIWIN